MITLKTLDKYYLERIPYPKNYKPTDWVKSVVDFKFRCFDKIYLCIGYDPNSGFWMENIDGTEELTNVSERAIGRTFHKQR